MKVLDPSMLGMLTVIAAPFVALGICTILAIVQQFPWLSLWAVITAVMTLIWRLI